MPQFNFAPLRLTGIALVKQFGRPAPCRLLRALDGAPVDVTKPWRPSAATQLVFQFTGVVLPFTIKRQVDLDCDATIYVPGDIVSVKEDSDPTILCGRIQGSDNIESQGVVYSLVGFRELTPGADPILFTLRCKAWPSDTMTPVTQF